MTNFEELLRGLVKHKVKFVLIGGLAAVAHGSALVTNDMDICYERRPANIKNLVTLLKRISARLRDAPGDLPFILDEKTFALGMNFTFETDLGNLDLIGEVAGLGTYSEVLSHAEPLDLYDISVEMLSLDGLIKAKQAAGRPKDELHLKELLAIKSLKS